MWWQCEYRVNIGIHEPTPLTFIPSQVYSAYRTASTCPFVASLAREVRPPRRRNQTYCENLLFIPVSALA